MDFIRKLPVIDLAFLLLVLLIMASAWKDIPAPQDMQTNAERQIALTTVQGASNSSITGVSIILASIAAVVGISKSLQEKAKFHYRIAAFFCIISLLAGVWNMGVLPQLVRKNLAYESSVGIVLIIQIWTLFLAALRMLLGIWNTLK